MVTAEDLQKLRKLVLQLQIKASEVMDTIGLARAKLRKCEAWTDSLQGDLKKLCESVQNAKDPQ